MPDHPISPARALDAAIHHGNLIADTPFAGGPFPPEILRTLAEAASEQVNVHALLHTPGYTLAEREGAVAIGVASMWAAGFKSGVQAAGPTD
jgi:hypothetical protein